MWVLRLKPRISGTHLRHFIDTKLPHGFFFSQEHIHELFIFKCIIISSILCVWVCACIDMWFSVCVCVCAKSENNVHRSVLYFHCGFPGHNSGYQDWAASTFAHCAHSASVCSMKKRTNFGDLQTRFCYRISSYFKTQSQRRFVKRDTKPRRNNFQWQKPVSAKINLNFRSWIISKLTFSE